MPLNSPLVQEWDTYDLDFYEYSLVCDDPELLKQLENRFVDTEYEEWEKEFERKQLEKQKQKQLEKQYEELENQFKKTPPDLPDSETVEWNNKPKTPTVELPMEEYEMGTNTEQIDDWVKEE